MKVILKEEIDNLGNAGDLVMVKDGYARNYLIPRQLAIRADERNVKQLEHHKRALERRRTKLKAEAIELEKQVAGVGRIVEIRACGPDGKLFGSVTSKELVEVLRERGVIIDKRQIVLVDPIKALGEREVTVKLGQGHVATLQVSVEPDETSAKAMALAAKAAAAAAVVAEREAAQAARRAKVDAEEAAVIAAEAAEESAEEPADEATPAE
jgi:large subunit ribosomal protein L9